MRLSTRVYYIINHSMCKEKERKNFVFLSALLSTAVWIADFMYTCKPQKLSTPTVDNADNSLQIT